MHLSRHSLAAPLLAIALIASGTSLALEGAEESLTVETKLGTGTTLVVENLLGSVHVVPSQSKGSARVEAHVVAEAKTPEEAEALAASIRLEQQTEGGTTRIHVAWPVDRFAAFRPPKSGMKGLIKRWAAPMLRGSSTVEYDGRLIQVGPERKATGLSVDLTVTLPYDVSTSIRQSVGTIDGRALRGRLRLETVDGDISFERCFGVLTAKTERGVVSVSAFQGEELDVSTAQGNMELTDVRADRARLQTDAGTIRGMRVTAGELVVESASGDVKLGGLEPTTAEVKTGSGKVDLATHLKTLRNAEIQTATGDVILRVGELTHFDLHAETKSGLVKTMGMTLDVLEQDGQASRLQHGQGGPALRISALGGSVQVRPYDASRLDLLLKN
jgi:hypothetical protein